MQFRLKAYQRKRQADELDTAVRLAAGYGRLVLLSCLLAGMAAMLWLLATRSTG